MTNSSFDVVILGSGLAGLTLSLQLKQSNKDLSVLVLEMRSGSAPDAAHKVGESTVELGTHYLREVLNLKDYLDKEQLPKHGLRFFFSPSHKEHIDKRVELGPRVLLPIPSHQLDRGTLENELARKAESIGVTVSLGSKVKAVEVDSENHLTEFEKDGETYSVHSKWVVDASGRSSFLKRKLGFKKDLDHDVNSAWFRVKGEIHLEDYCKNEAWNGYVEKGLRRLSTIHFMGKGYWVWFIPLATGNTSVGIVADPRFHPLETYNKYEKAMDWLKENEPFCYEILDKKRDEVLDFRILKHFAHSSERLYSTDRWAVTGESGVFLDPFYSPGTDFISLSNTLVSDLILRDFAGEDIHLRTNVYERTLFALFENWVPIYRTMYELWGNTQTMVLKIFWDWATYWSIPTLLFTNEGYTNIMVLRDLFASEGCVGQRFGQLNRKMQELFLAWSEFDNGEFTDRYIDPFDIGYLRTFHKEIDERYEGNDLINKVHSNLTILEQIASEVFRLISNKVHGTPLDLEVDPYTMDIKAIPSNKKTENVDPFISKEVRVMWFYPIIEESVSI